MEKVDVDQDNENISYPQTPRDQFGVVYKERTHDCLCTYFTLTGTDVLRVAVCVKAVDVHVTHFFKFNFHPQTSIDIKMTIYI